MTHYKKLVRDKIPQILDEKGVTYKKTILNDKEYEIELGKKLTEEAKEFSDDSSSEELADVMEVVESLKKLSKYQDVDAVKEEKREKRGGFDEKIMLEGEKD